MSEPGAPHRLVRCVTCMFWAPFNGAVGVCRRRAPVPSAGSDIDTVAHWPETFAEEGCGEGQLKPSDGSTPLMCQACMYWMQGGAEGGLEPVAYNDQLRTWWRNAGRCVRHAPMPIANPGARLLWPATHATDGCGKAVARGSTEPERLQEHAPPAGGRR